MNYLLIQNQGELDMQLLYLIGGTTKDEDEFKIGRFGTGLKYCLAYLLRNDVKIRIFIGENEVKIGKIQKTIREKEFDIITIDGNETPLTTKLGVDFKPWMVVRELYSNALDEGEAIYGVSPEELLRGEPGKTSFFIEFTNEFLEVYNNWDRYFIVNHIPMYENDNFAIYPKEGNLRVYKQGILIEEKKAESIFNYDIKDALINELREYNGYLDGDLAECLFKIDNKKVIEYFLENLTEDHYESKIDFEFVRYRGNFNPVWQETIGKAKIIHQEAKDRILGANPLADLSDTINVPKAIYKALTKVFEGIGALRSINKVNEFYEIYDEELNLKVKQALTILEECKYFIHPELKFVFGDFGDKKVLARIDIDKKEILVSQKMKDKSLFNFCAMIIEENEHFNTGFEDCSRDFQQHFIDLFTHKMLELHEIKI